MVVQHAVPCPNTDSQHTHAIFTLIHPRTSAKESDEEKQDDRRWMLVTIHQLNNWRQQT